MSFFKKIYRLFTLEKKLYKMLESQNEKMRENLDELMDGKLSVDESYENGRTITILELINYVEVKKKK